MAASHHPTTHYPARNLVESAGGIVFSKPTSSSVDCRRRICILYDERRKEYLLAKGRRDHGESRGACALREVREETGLKRVSLMPVTLECRTTPPPPPPPPPANPDTQEASALASDPNTPNIVRVFENTTEPFMCSVRDMSSSSSRPKKRGGNGMQVKFIWWYVMEADVSGDAGGDTNGDGDGDGDGDGRGSGSGDGEDGPAGEPGLMRSWLSVEEALRTLTFEGDREVVREAVRIVERRDAVDTGKGNDASRDETATGTGMGKEKAGL